MTALLAVDLPAALEAKPNPSLMDLLGLETINDSFNVLNTNLASLTFSALSKASTTRSF